MDERIWKTVVELARELGFANAYPLAPAELSLWQERAAQWGVAASLPHDIAARWPWAKTVVLLLWTYRPFAAGERISPYYLASNAAYHASRALEAQAQKLGIRLERASLPARALCIANGLGAPGKNGLLSIGEYGTRFAMETLLLEDAARQGATVRSSPCGKGCTACAAACPMAAIGAQGLDARRCMRYLMGKQGYTPAIWEAQQTFMGCEICQSVCPKNAGLATACVPREASEAFELKRLITGDTGAARSLVGRNSTTNGRLTAEAIAFAAKKGLYEQEIRACLSSPFEQVRSAAGWALNSRFGKITGE